MLRLTSFLLLAFFLGAVGQASAAQGPWVLPATGLSESGGDAYEPQLARGSDGSTTAVWWRHNGTNSIVQTASKASGGSFGPVTNLSEPGQDSFGTRISTGPDGTTTAVWYRHDGSNWIVQAATRPPGGSFGQAVDLSVPGRDSMNPEVSVGPGGATTVVWQRQEGSNWIIQAASRPANGTFGTAVDLSEPGESAYLPQLDTGPDGTTTVVWQRTAGLNWTVQVSSRAPGGSFGPATDISEPGPNAPNPEVSAGAAGAATVAWTRSSFIQAASRPAGGAFGAAVDLSAAGQGASGSQVVTGSDGTVTVAWQRFDGSNSIVQATTKPPGGAFGQVVDLSEPGQDADEVGASVGPDGTTNVVWNRSDGSNWIVQAATRAPGGTFGPAVDLSEAGQDGTEPQISTGPDGVTTAIWSRSDGTDDLVQTASTKQVSFGLKVTKQGTGDGGVKSTPAGIDCGATCQAFFDVGSKVNLTASPAKGSIFGGWTGTCASAGQSPTCQVTVDQAKEAGATFSKVVQLPLTVTKQGVGSGQVKSSPAGIDCGQSCQASFDAGSKVKLAASPAKGSMFTGWSGACAGADASCVVTMDQARSVVAKFAPLPTDLSSVFDGKFLYVRLKCAARFKPGCKGFAQAVTKKRKGKPMSSKVSAAQKAGKWKIVKLKVKPAFKSKIARMAKQPTKKTLVVKSVVSAKKFKRGKKSTVFHTYRVRTAG